MGLPGCDIDDGMALLYLLGQEQIHLAAVTTSFGNSTIEKVYANTQRMFRELRLEHIPLKKGAFSRQDRHSEASHFLAADISRRQQPVTLLITGSPTNIYAACLENLKILDDIEELVFMGGITEPLMIGGKQMAELNFSSDPEATHYLLNCPVKKTVLSAQICLNAFFDEQKVQKVSELQDYPALAYLQKPLRLWYDFISRKYGNPGFHVWDIVAAVYITNPGLFDRHEVSITSTIDDLHTGFLRTGKVHGSHRHPVNLPTRIQHIEHFWHCVFESWKHYTS